MYSRAKGSIVEVASSGGFGNRKKSLAMFNRGVVERKFELFSGSCTFSEFGGCGLIHPRAPSVVISNFPSPQDRVNAAGHSSTKYDTSIWDVTSRTISTGSSCSNVSPGMRSVSDHAGALSIRTEVKPTRPTTVPEKSSPSKPRKTEGSALSSMTQRCPPVCSQVRRALQAA